jgi:hypothetical protein
MDPRDANNYWLLAERATAVLQGHASAGERHRQVYALSGKEKILAKKVQ